MAYNTYIVLTGTMLLGIVSGVVGSFAVLRRRALMGDALSHAALPGICLAFLVIGDRHFVALLIGAVVTGTLGVLVVAVLRTATRIKEDAAIGIVLSVFFGAGIVLSRMIQNLPSGNRAGLDSFIFGKTAGMIRADVILIGWTAAAVLAATLLLFKEFKLLSFDREFGAVQGWPVLVLDIMMMALLVVTTVIGLPAVGVVLMAALLIIPGAAARFWTDRLPIMLILSALFGGTTGAAGSFISAYFDSSVLPLPAGPVIVLVGAVIFVVSMLAAPRRGVLARLWRRLRLRERIAHQNLLRSMYELTEENVLARPAVALSALTARRGWTPRLARKVARSGARRGAVEPAGTDRFRLTESGVEQAASVVRSHRLWELYLIDQASIPADHVDRDADTIEHFLPSEIVQQLEARLSESGRWPRGSKLPPKSPHVIEPLSNQPRETL